jgi:hypothetical protein
MRESEFGAPKCPQSSFLHSKQTLLSHPKNAVWEINLARQNVHNRAFLHLQQALLGHLKSAVYYGGMRIWRAKMSTIELSAFKTGTSKSSQKRSLLWGNANLARQNVHNRAFCIQNRHFCLIQKMRSTMGEYGFGAPKMSTIELSAFKTDTSVSSQKRSLLWGNVNLARQNVHNLLSAFQTSTSVSSKKRSLLWGNANLARQNVHNRAFLHSKQALLSHPKNVVYYAGM